MKNQKMSQQGRPHNKEVYIQFLRGPMTNLVIRVNKDEPETLKKSIAAIEFLCYELSLR